MKSWSLKAAKALQTLCGWALVYLSIGAAVGFLFDRPYTDAPTCLPFTSVFGVLETTCPNQPVDIFWMIAVEIPRAVILMLAIPLGLLLASAIHGGHWWLEAIRWLALSVPLLLVTYAGFLYWRHRSLPIALLLMAVLGTEATLLGIKM